MPRVYVLVLATTLAGCEQYARFQAARAETARYEDLRRIMDDSNLKTAALWKKLDSETWGMGKDYQIHREGTEVRLWRADDKLPRDGDIPKGRICVLNGQPHQPWPCDAQQRKIGRILLDIEEEDRRFRAAWEAAFPEQAREVRERLEAEKDAPTPK